MEKLNVAIADDNEKMLDLLGNLINEDKELELVVMPTMAPIYTI